MSTKMHRFVFVNSASCSFRIDLLGDKCAFGINVDLRRDARLAANLAAWATPGKAETVCSSIMASVVRLFFACYIKSAPYSIVNFVEK